MKPIRNLLTIGAWLIASCLTEGCSQESLCDTQVVLTAGLMGKAGYDYEQDPTPANCKAYCSAWLTCYQSIKDCGGDVTSMQPLYADMKAGKCK